MLSVDEFASRIKTKYPEYKDVDNLELTNRIISKYPEYKNEVQLEPPGESFWNKVKESASTMAEPYLKAADYFTRPLPGTQKVTGAVFEPIAKGIEKIQGAVESNPTMEVLSAPLKTAFRVGSWAARSLAKTGASPLDILTGTMAGKMKLLFSAPEAIKAAEFAKMRQAAPEAFEAAKKALPANEALSIDELMARTGTPEKAQAAASFVPPAEFQTGARAFVKPATPAPTGRPFSLGGTLPESEQQALEAFQAKLKRVEPPRIELTASFKPVPTEVPAPVAKPAVAPVYPNPGGEYTGRPNLSLIGDVNSQDLAMNLTDKYGEVLERGKGGVVSDEELTRMAAELHLTPEEVATYKASPVESARVLAANAVKMDVLKQLTGQIVKTRLDNPADMDAAAQMIAKAVNTMKGADALASEAGRSLRSRKVSTSLLEKVQQAEYDALDTEALKANPKKLKDIITRLKSFGDMTQGQLEDEVRKAIPFGKKMLEYVQGNSLWSPTTSVRNFIGGPVGLMGQLGTRLGASVFAVPERIAGAQGSQKMGEIPAMLAGQVDGLYDGLIKGIDTIVKGTKSDIMAGEKVEGAIAGKFGKVIRFPFRVLQGTDDVFETAAQRGEAWSLAYRKAADRGGTLQDIWQHAKSIVNTDPEILRKADLVRKEWTFKMRPGEEALRLKEGGATPNLAYKAVEGMGELGKDVARLRNRYPGTVGSFLLRFLSTPVNIYKLSNQLGPTAFLSPRNISAIMASPELRADALGRIAFGGAATYAVANAILSGRITGPMPKDAKARKYWQEKGISPYSLVVGDKYIPVDSIAILGGVVTSVADTIAAYHNKESDDKIGDMISAASFSVANNMLNQPFMTGMRDLFRSVQYGQLTEGFQKVMANTGQSFIPGFTALGFTARQIDKTIRKPKGAADYVKVGLPFLSKQVPPALGAFGQERKRSYILGGTLPANQAKSDPVVDMLENLDISLPTYPASISGVPLTREMQENIQRNSGQRIKNRLALLASQPYQQNPEAATRIVRMIIDQEIDAEKNRVVPMFQFIQRLPVSKERKQQLIRERMAQ